MRPIPQAVVSRAELLARAHPLQTVAALIGVTPSQITLMKKRGWKAARVKPLRPMPNDFAIQSAHMTFDELVKHYRAGTATVGRWMREVPEPRPSWRAKALCEWHARNRGKGRNRHD